MLTERRMARRAAPRRRRWIPGGDQHGGARLGDVDDLEGGRAARRGDEDQHALVVAPDEELVRTARRAQGAVDVVVAEQHRGVAIADVVELEVLVLAAAGGAAVQLGAADHAEHDQEVASARRAAC
jgi:hypothetical protein